ncbi:hypothetical protein FRC08_017921 [Ceratobasidium sp. 394]|nr:hypothetical protein FRC08_017921 [Ceratobasidium sp. 394]KAG9091601.1 hypothetical protein FS749_016415 [Ceratobasidium sp. UAMH 11750]
MMTLTKHAQALTASKRIILQGRPTTRRAFMHPWHPTVEKDAMTTAYLNYELPKIEDDAELQNRLKARIGELKGKE